MINYIKKILRKTRITIVKIANRKHFIDVLVAMLTIPVLLTVLITNILTLQSKNQKAVTTTTNAQVIIKEVMPKTPPSTKTIEEAITPANENCKKELGPISIVSPEENEVIKDNPVCITIKYDNQNYCTVVWSYRINESSWSEYSSNSVCLYNVPSGKVKFDLRIQSTVSNDQATLTRNFTFEGTKSSSSSAITQ